MKAKRAITLDYKTFFHAIATKADYNYWEVISILAYNNYDVEQNNFLMIYKEDVLSYIKEAISIQSSEIAIKVKEAAIEYITFLFKEYEDINPELLIVFPW